MSIKDDIDICDGRAPVHLPNELEKAWLRIKQAAKNWELVQQMPEQMLLFCDSDATDDQRWRVAVAGKPTIYTTTAEEALRKGLMNNNKTPAPFLPLPYQLKMLERLVQAVREVFRNIKIAL